MATCNRKNLIRKQSYENINASDSFKVLTESSLTYEIKSQSIEINMLNENKTKQLNIHINKTPKESTK